MYVVASQNKYVGAKHSGEELLGHRAIIFPNVSPYPRVWRNISGLGSNHFFLGKDEAFGDINYPRIS